MFSARVSFDLQPNRLSQALSRMRASGQPVIDLTQSNPTRAGFEYPDDLLAPLSDRRGLQYAPHPLGLRVAREAVAHDFARRGAVVRPYHVALTASTSEAYSILFKLLCDPGDEVLVPQPSYPLFEHLIGLDAVVAVPYDLEYHGRWEIDVASVEQAVSPRTRAVLVVNPNNPTGNLAGVEEMARLASICRQSDAAIISDEVFADYPLSDGTNPESLAGHPTETLTFTLGGLSKTVGLPQLKLSWIAVSGSATHVSGAMPRLELACDTYLSVSTPVQAAVPELLHRGEIIRRQIQERVRTNYRRLLDRASRSPACSALRSDAGWYAVVQVPSLVPEEELVLHLLETDHVLVHPGYFFDFPRESFLIVSLLAPSQEFELGISTMFRLLDRGMQTP